MTIIVTREYLISLLQAWKDKKITAEELMESASLLYDDGEALDWENGEDNSITMEVLQKFESLDINLLTVDDVNIYIELLKTPIGKYKEGRKKIDRYYVESFDIEERKKRLKGIKPYIV